MYVCILLQSVPVLRAPTAAFAMVLIRRNGGTIGAHDVREVWSPSLMGRVIIPQAYSVDAFEILFSAFCASARQHVPSPVPGFTARRVTSKTEVWEVGKESEGQPAN